MAWNAGPSFGDTALKNAGRSDLKEMLYILNGSYYSPLNQLGPFT